MAPSRDEVSLYRLVVVGSSAGGIEALSTLVATLPADFSAPLVLAQHLDPHHLSHLGEILARRSALPVRTVLDHERLEPGVVYVVPSNRHVEIADHTVRVSADDASEEKRPKPSVDRLLTSAAHAYGEQLIAVILTGTGSDGAVGARAVKAAGGAVIIENPATAAYPGMPESLAPTTVDFVSDLERIAPLLQDLLSGVHTAMPPEADDLLLALLANLREQTGMDFSHYKRPTILCRLQRRMVSTGTRQLVDYAAYLAHHPEEGGRLAASFLINVTEFFRDPAFYAALRERVLPELIAYARTQGNVLRIWSAGCATGEEAYSVAILVAEALRDELSQFA
ncbi:MAG: chemotaxis protein CheB, partial [Ktedonobacterales bacterium]